MSGHFNYTYPLSLTKPQHVDTIFILLKVSWHILLPIYTLKWEHSQFISVKDEGTYLFSVFISSF